MGLQKKSTACIPAVGSEGEVGASRARTSRKTTVILPPLRFPGTRTPRAWKSDDRRTSRRFPLSGCKATLSRPGLMASLGLGPKSIGDVLDLNTKGARILLCERVSLFEAFRVLLRSLDGGQRSVAIKARTVWLKPGPDDGTWEVGLHFLVTDAAAADLQEIVRVCRSEARAR